MSEVCFMSLSQVQVRQNRVLGLGSSYMWLLGGEGGGCVGGSGNWSLFICFVSVERVLTRRSPRWPISIGDVGGLAWARSDGATMLLSSSPSASQGGICNDSVGYKSDTKAEFSIPPWWKKKTELVPQGSILETLLFSALLLLFLYKWHYYWLLLFINAPEQYFIFY